MLVLSLLTPRSGCLPDVVVLNSKRTIEEAMVRKWVDFAGRPQIPSCKGWGEAGAEGGGKGRPAAPLVSSTPPALTHRQAGVAAQPGPLAWGLLPALEGPQKTDPLRPAAGRAQLHGAPCGAADPGVL